MKKLKMILSILSIYCIFQLSLPTTIVNAKSSTYLRVLGDEVYIYQDSLFSGPIFCIPKTYYVKLESEQSGALKVSYGNPNQNTPIIVGYMKPNDLTKTEIEPSNPFAIIKVSTDTTDILFNDLSLKNPYFNVNKNEILYYYGDAVNGDTVLCYVYYGNKLGYIDKSCLNPFTITPNLDPYDTETPDISNPIESPDINSTQKINLGENLQIIIIVGISIVSISVVYFLFKPQKFKTSEEQNEFTSE